MVRDRKSVFIISLLVLTMLACFISFVGFANASITAGNPAQNLSYSYRGGSNLTGWINISISNEPSNSRISFFNSNISLKSFLDKAHAVYSCTTLACNLTYFSSELGESSKSFSLDTGASNLIGLKITDAVVSEISSLIMSISSNAVASCSNQLAIDFGDDGSYDWQNTKQKQEYCSSENYGCYSTSSLTTDVEVGKEYCANINITSASGILVGADVVGSGNANFTFFVDNTYFCNNVISSSGKVSCFINKSIITPQMIEVCLRTNLQTNYKIYYEQTSPCGSFSEQPGYDFSIFVNTLKFEAPGQSIINSSISSSGIIDIIDTYLDKYNRNCSLGCYIPMRILASQNQQITISNALLEYRDVNGLKKQTTLLYNLSTEQAKINMVYSKVTLDSSGLSTPSNYGTFNLSINLNSQPILYKSFEVLSLPVINSLIPISVPAGVDTFFIANVDGINISSYTWKFGDNTTSTTTLSNTTHKYNTIGQYILSLTATNLYGNTVRNFSINVTTPIDYLNVSLKNYQNNTATLRNIINYFPAAVKSYIENDLKLSDIETKIQQYIVQFNAAGGDSSIYVNIINLLSSINLPNSIIKSQSASGIFMMQKSKVSASAIAAMSGEAVPSTNTSLADAVFSWFVNSLDATATVENYDYVYSNYTKSALGYIKLAITPKVETDKAYLIVTLPSDKVTLTGSKDLSGSVGLEVSLTSVKNLEMVIGYPADILNLPIFISPAFSKLSLGKISSECNNNGKCESGENTKNCANDCKPWIWALVWIGVLLILFLILYILLQEWYKRKYEDYLFKDKNELFNLIHFIANAETQGLRKEAIFSKLALQGWHNEQMVFAYKRFKGQRTGMLEIPIFRKKEQKEVNDQMIERRNIKVNTNMPPAPRRPFVKKI